MNQLRQLTAFCIALAHAERQRGQGWSNAATFLAHLYLTQERMGCVEIERARRKSDGGVHPEKLRIIYEQLVARGVCSPIDEWALEPAIDIPPDLAAIACRLTDDGIPTHLQPRVNWNEIAEYVKDEYNRSLCAVGR